MTLMPVITAYGGAAVRSSTLTLIGQGFGRVVSAQLVNAATLDQYNVDHIVNNGSSVTITVPRLLPDASYFPLLGTLDGTVSQNLAGLLVIPDPLPSVPPPVPPAPDPVPDTTSPAMVAIRKRLRLEIGDWEERFEATVLGDGQARRFDLPYEVIEPDGLVVVLTAVDGSSTTLAPSDYDLDTREGVLTLPDPPADDATLTVNGRHFQFFTDTELDEYVRSAALKHVHGAESLQVYRSLDGFKRFLYVSQTVDGVSPVEYHLVALLAAVEALEVILTDAAFDIDVTTAEGTSLPREERFRNLTELMMTKQARYETLAMQLGVGLGRVEVFTMRRVSRTTGKLVPVYVDREYDDVRTPPLRVFAPRSLGTTGSGFTQPDPLAYGGSAP